MHTHTQIYIYIYIYMIASVHIPTHLFAYKRRHLNTY